MNLDDLAREYVVKVGKFLGDAIEEYLEARSDELFVLLEKPALQLLELYSRGEDNWSDFHEEVRRLLGDPSGAGKFFKKRGWVPDGIEKKLLELRGLDEESFYVRFYKIEGVVDIFNNVFDTVSFIKSGYATKGDFYF